ncbi:MAG: osmotically inducible protein OsmC [Candidatus Aminicenantes bacterium]|nr:osmotically inducible protein OsmC [Candidatus Aminicenantes bacterium]
MDQEIKVSFPGGVRVDAEYKGFIIKTDQPKYQGGEGSQPAPFDLFLASLAACAGYYVLVFCNKRGISTEEASVVMRTSKSAETKMVEKISIEIQLPPDFPEKYKNAVIKAVDSCSVKIHILNPPAFEILAKIGN